MLLTLFTAGYMVYHKYIFFMVQYLFSLAIIASDFHLCNILGSIPRLSKRSVNILPVHSDISSNLGDPFKLFYWHPTGVPHWPAPIWFGCVKCQLNVENSLLPRPMLPSLFRRPCVFFLGLLTCFCRCCYQISFLLFFPKYYKLVQAM